MKNDSSKLANVIIIGGPVAVGKSTLVQSIGLKSVQELDPNDKLQKALLKGMMELDKSAGYLFQFDMLKNRSRIYKEKTSTGELHVFDRSIFEDWLFAKSRFGNEKHIWEFYQFLWELEISKMSRPKLYIVLTCSWDVFKERIFARNRPEEIDNFNKNEKLFKEQIEIYEEYMKNILEKYNIDYCIINTNDLSAAEVLSKAKRILIEKGITNE